MKQSVKNEKSVNYSNIKLQLDLPPTRSIVAHEEGIAVCPHPQWTEVATSEKNHILESIQRPMEYVSLTDGGLILHIPNFSAFCLIFDI